MIGDASTDRSPHRFMVYAHDLRSGDVVWEAPAHEGVPVDKPPSSRPTPNSAPAVDDKVVVAFFGSEGLFAFDHQGRALWHVDLGRLDVGAYNLRAYEWGPASSPILWNGLVIVQCDSHGDSFMAAYDALTGEPVWRVERDEIPPGDTPTVVESVDPPEIVTNGSNWIRGNNALTGEDSWRLGGSSKITAPTPIVAGGLVIVASGRAPERPIFAVKPGSRGDLTLEEENVIESFGSVELGAAGFLTCLLPWPTTAGSMCSATTVSSMPTRSRRETRSTASASPTEDSGFSTSLVAADGRIYLSGEGGEVFVIRAGDEFVVEAELDMGEPLMATPAIVDGTLLIRGRDHLFAIGR